MRGPRQRCDSCRTSLLPCFRTKKSEFQSIERGKVLSRCCGIQSTQKNASRSLGGRAYILLYRLRRQKTNRCCLLGGMVRDSGVPCRKDAHTCTHKVRKSLYPFPGTRESVNPSLRTTLSALRGTSV